MTNPDLLTWIRDVAGLVQTNLPLQSLDTATNLTYTYLSDVGGWIPDDPIDPNGPGVPANHVSEQTASDTIVTQQLSGIYDIRFKVTAVIDVNFMAQLGSGLSLNAAAAAMATEVTNFVTDHINSAPDVPMRVDAITAQSILPSSSLQGGSTTTALRTHIQAIITGGLRLVDYKCVALQYARETNGLDTTWNVQFVYTQPGDPLVAQIAKYTDTTYATLDSDSTTIYVYSISPTTYQIVTGVILSA